MKKIVPRHDWVLVKPSNEDSSVTENGILVPTTEEHQKKSKGTVQEAGQYSPDLYVGDEVIYGTFAGEVLKRFEDGKEVEYKLLKDEDIIAVLR